MSSKATSASGAMDPVNIDMPSPSRRPMNGLPIMPALDLGADAKYIAVANSDPSAKWTPAKKAYQDSEFLASREARLLRIICEYQQPAKAMRDHKVDNTILLFASARGKSREQYNTALTQLAAQVETLTATASGGVSGGEDNALATASANLSRLKRTEWMCHYYDVVEETARLLAQWGVSRKQEGLQEYSISTGGGPGLMEAANKGASSVKGAKSLGLGISLPFEAGLNRFVSPELAFEFHYFFTRKLWMTLPCKALIVAPGGFGTCDELFEFICLQQTGKKDWTPVVLLGTEYWKTVINWEAMAAYGTVSDQDIKRLKFVDTPEEVFEYLKGELEKMEQSLPTDHFELDA
jgi:uncharacterized protein (TIGR00730 family)